MIGDTQVTENLSARIHNYQQMDILDGQKRHGFPSDIKGIATAAAAKLILP